MNRFKHPQYGSTLEAIVYPLLLLVVLWVVYWGEKLHPIGVYEWGVLPQELSGLKGVLFSPLIHSIHDFSHIINNSIPIAILLSALVYFYKEVAAKVFFMSWIFSGLFVWVFAKNVGAYHVGISGVIYALAGFLFVSGTLRSFKPLQGISLFVAFLYGSMIWGIFPMEERVSWEGHLGGFMTGIVLAFIYRKKGPQRPKFQYEIEKEMGIEPPDLEGQWKAAVEQYELELRLKEQEKLAQNEQNSTSPIEVVYHFKKKEENES
jgi:membrane associated rhomboid family serine protease